MKTWKKTLSLTVICLLLTATCVIIHLMTIGVI